MKMDVVIAADLLWLAIGIMLGAMYISWRRNKDE